MAATTQTYQNCTMDSSSQTYNIILVSRSTQTDIDPMVKIEGEEKPMVKIEGEENGAIFQNVKTPTVKDKRCFKKRFTRIRAMHCCIYCRKLMENLGRHLQNVHRHEKDVVRIFALQPNLRRKALIALARKGDYYHNVNVLANKKGTLIVARKPNSRDRKKYSHSDYACCPYCRAFIRKKTLETHQRVCRAANSDSNSEEEDPVEIKIECSNSSDDVVEADCAHLEDDLAMDPLKTDDICADPNNSSGNQILENVNDHDSILAKLLLSSSSDETNGESTPPLGGCKSLVSTYSVKNSTCTSVEIDPEAQPGTEVNVIAPNVKEKNIFEPLKKNKNRFYNYNQKSHCCVYCMKVVVNINMHFQLEHINEEEVSRLLEIDNDSMRTKGFIALARKGDYCYNLKVMASENGKLILARNTKKDSSETYSYSDYSCCSHCLGFMSKQYLEWHEKRCFLNPAKLNSTSHPKTRSIDETVMKNLVDHENTTMSSCNEITVTSLKVKKGGFKKVDNSSPSSSENSVSDKFKSYKRETSLFDLFGREGTDPRSKSSWGTSKSRIYLNWEVSNPTSKAARSKVETDAASFPLRAKRNSPFSEAYGRGYHTRTRWTSTEKEAVMLFYRDHLRRRILPKKEDALKCKEQFKVLSDRSWKDIKFYIYNQLRLNRETFSRHSETPFDNSDRLLTSTDEEECGEVSCDDSKDPFAMDETEQLYVEEKENDVHGALSESAEDINIPNHESAEKQSSSSSQEEQATFVANISSKPTSSENEKEDKRHHISLDPSDLRDMSLESTLKEKESNSPGFSCNLGLEHTVQSCSNRKRRWTSDEHDTLMAYYGEHIKEKKVPKKEDAEECMRLNPSLNSRTWRDIKFYVHNQILKLKRNK